MFAPLPEEAARKECEKMMNEFDADRSLVAGKGAMYGILVCRDGSGKEVVLKSFSGLGSGMPERKGWVPPLFNVKKYQQIVEKSETKIHDVMHQIAGAHTVSNCIELKSQRKKIQNEALREECDLYKFPCIDGSVKTFDQILSGYKEKKVLPLEGTGDCCAPKAFGYAFAHNLVPVSYAEFYYNVQGRDGAINHKSYGTPCDERCAVVLPAMLGLEILYRDNDIIVVNKQCDLTKDGVVTHLQRLFSKCIKQPVVHELGKDTSGVLVLAFSTEAQKKLKAQFESNEVKFAYTGIIRGKLEESKTLKEGQTSGKFQMDSNAGTISWKKLRVRKVSQPLNAQVPTEFITLVQFTLQISSGAETAQPEIEEQIRRGCAKQIGLALVGDSTYGERREGETLQLRETRMEFTHPVTGKKLIIEKELEF